MWQVGKFILRGMSIMIFRCILDILKLHYDLLEFLIINNEYKEWIGKFLILCNKKGDICQLREMVKKGDIYRIFVFYYRFSSSLWGTRWTFSASASYSNSQPNPLFSEKKKVEGRMAWNHNAYLSLSIFIWLCGQ